eukprot:TRINITY_DN7464_c0_g1_i1.p1 TRINITY_DN7464_c0_g1~~TRINITY_DN7464_c0_g1_i1.p1  ORF type:complete len:464 (-),score=120.44 TRINITY_DN7464_c0_g1_i1:105-1454(-)
MSSSTKQQRKVFVIGVGMSKFYKPQKDPGAGPHYPELAKTAVTRALMDACISPDLIEQAAVGNMFAGNGAGQRSLYDMGIFDIPVYNLNNACATGSSALFLAKQLVGGGLNDCCLALGVEKMKPGSLGGGKMDGAPTSLDLHMPVMMSKFDFDFGVAPMPQFFGNAGREHMAKYGTTKHQLALIGEKNHRHSKNNPYAQFRKVYTIEQIENSRSIYEPLTMLQCSPTSDGAAAAIVCSEDFVIRHGLQGQAVEIVGLQMLTDNKRSFNADKLHDRSVIDMIGFPMAQRCAQTVFKQAGLTPNDVHVVELHDCFSANELITYEALGLCEEGKGGQLVESGNCTYGGKYVVNPSGGLISKGHPLGATGIAQCAELCWQLRNEAGPRQVKDARVGLQHNLGLGGACVIGLYKRPSNWLSHQPKRERSGGMGFDSEEVPPLDELRAKYTKARL